MRNAERSYWQSLIWPASAVAVLTITAATTLPNAAIADEGGLSFWLPITVYDADGRFQKNKYDAYSVNNLTAKKSVDGSVDVQFGGCDGKIPNCLPIVPG